MKIDNESNVWNYYNYKSLRTTFLLFSWNCNTNRNKCKKISSYISSDSEYWWFILENAKLC